MNSVNPAVFLKIILINLTFIFHSAIPNIMQLPTPLLRHKSTSHKNTFGHVLVIAGSKRMLGAAALTSLACMRAGAGLTTLGIPESLNSIAQKKISNVIMTWPLKETKKQSISSSAYNQILPELNKYSVIALGPGLSQEKSTQQFIRKIIFNASCPIVIDADAINALQGHLSILKQSSCHKLMTPHSGELARITSTTAKYIESNRMEVVKKFAKENKVVLLLKGHHSVIADVNGKTTVNKTGNSGMATAGSGDVLTGICAAFIAQGLSTFDAAKFGAYIHGLAGDYCADKMSKTAMIASDLIDFIPIAFKKLS